MTAGLYLTKIRNVYAGIAPLEPKRIELAVTNFLIGVLFCITIIGIPFGKQFFKIAKLAVMPFGATVERVNYL